MPQQEISPSTEAYEINEFIRVRRWLIDPRDCYTGGTVDHDKPPVLLARSAIVFIRVVGHLLHLHTVSGCEYVCRGTLKSLQQRWAQYGLVRIFNSYLVFLSHVQEVRHESDGPKVILAYGRSDASLPISRERYRLFEQLWETWRAQ